MRIWMAGLLCAALLSIPTGTATATNLPPPNSTETWVSLGEGPDGPQWQIDGFSSFSEDWELFDIEPSVIGSLVPGDQGEPIGWNVSVTIPNFVDPLTTKSIKVVFEGANPEPESLPFVQSIIAVDTLFGGGATSEIVCPEDCELIFAEFRVDENEEGELIGQAFERWELHPNPDWETINVFIPFEFELTSFHIRTRSFGEVVPEPSSLALVTAGLLGLATAGRRRR